jgi:DNA polymerase elongation subunit (family B)
VVDVFGRDEGGKRVHKVLTGTRPYFYARRPPHRQSTKIAGVVQDAEDIFGNPVHRIYTTVPSDVPEIRAWYPRQDTFEANVLYDQRIRVDEQCFGVVDTPDSDIIRPGSVRRVEGVSIEPRYAHVDIETDGPASVDEPRAEVISVSVYDSFADMVLTIVVGRVDEPRVRECIDSALRDMVGGDEGKFEEHRFRTRLKIVTVMSEEELFEKLDAYLTKYRPDLFLAWNVDFDYDYLVNRAKAEGYRLSLRNVEKFDVMKGYSRIHEGANRESLEWCSNRDFGFGKVSYSGTISEFYRRDRERFVAYNVWDVHLSEKLNRKRNILGFHLSIAGVSSASISNTIYNSRIIDAMMLYFVKHVLKRDRVLPTYPSEGGVIDQGSYVHEPARGRFRKVLVLDLKSEYPSAIISFNLSPETRWRGDAPPPDPENYYVTPRGNYYRKGPVGILPAMLMMLMSERDEMKRTRELHPVPRHAAGLQGDDELGLRGHGVQGLPAQGPGGGQ